MDKTDWGAMFCVVCFFFNLSVWNWYALETMSERRGKPHPHLDGSKASSAGILPCMGTPNAGKTKHKGTHSE